MTGPVKWYKNNFWLSCCFFLQLQGSKRYSGINIQYATCLITISTPLPIYFWTRAEKLTFFVCVGETLISIEKMGKYVLKKLRLPTIKCVVWHTYKFKLIYKKTSKAKTSNSPFKKCMVPVLQDWPSKGQWGWAEIKHIRTIWTSLNLDSLNWFLKIFAGFLDHWKCQVTKKGQGTPTDRRPLHH